MSNCSPTALMARLVGTPRDGKSRFPGDNEQSLMWVDEPEEPHAYFPQLAIGDHNRFRIFWLALLSWALVYVGTLLPFRIAFIDFHIPNDMETGVAWALIVWIVDIIFLVDLVLNFFFTYRDNHEREVRCLKRIGCRYLRGAFFIDLISCIPPPFFQIILEGILNQEQEESTVHKSPWLMKLHRVPRLAKLIRILRLFKIFNFARSNHVVERLRSNRAVRVLYFVLGFIAIAHIVGSGWYLVAALHDDYTDTWIYRRYDAYGDETLTELELAEKSTPVIDWLQSMYFVLTVFTTVGFGDISAFTVGEMIYAIFAMIIGTMANGVIMGEMINSIALVDAVSIERNEQTALLESFSEHTQLSEDVTRQLKGFIASTKDIHRTYERGQIKLLIMRNVFPRSLEQQVPEALFHGQLLKNRLFKYCRRFGPLPFQLPLFVALAVHQKFMVTNEMAYVAGDQPNSIHLVLTGVFASLTRRRPVDYDGHTRDIWFPHKSESFQKGELMIKNPILDAGATARTTSTTTKKQGTRTLAKVGEFFPFQLYCRRSYFGDMEVMQDLVVRRDSVRCESDGSMLVIEKHDIAELAKEFPRHIILLRQAAARRWQRSRKMSVLALLPFADHRDVAASSIQRFWVDHRERLQLRLQQEEPRTLESSVRYSERLLTSPSLMAVSEVAGAGGLTDRHHEIFMSLPGRRMHHHDDIFAPSIQNEVDRVRTDVHELRQDVQEMRTEMGGVNDKLDKVMSLLTAVTISGKSRPLTL